jgi:type VI secretion system protein ImpH
VKSDLPPDLPSDTLPALDEAGLPLLPAEEVAPVVVAEAPEPAALSRHAQWLQKLAAEPWRYDFYQTLRHFEAAHPHLPRLGEAVRPADEPLRVGQPADLSFAPAPLHSLQLGDKDNRSGTPWLMQRIFGLLGPNGPLPTHMTELAGERSRHHGDRALQRFLDTLTHRFALLFYRAWAQAQPEQSFDRPGDTQFARRLGALAGLGNLSLLQRDAAGDAAKLHFTGRLGRHVRDAEGLLGWCRSQFNAHVEIEQWCGHWMPLAREERSRLSAPDRGSVGMSLGQGAVLGQTVWDVQHKFRVVIGPLPLQRYRDFLPGGNDLARLQAIVRQWVGIELEWDLRLILAKADVPRMQLGGPGAAGMLGRTSWLGQYTRTTDADDLTLDVERTLHARRRKAAAHEAAAAPAAA